MYYPQSKILTNQYTNGQEFVYLSTGVSYEGVYHIFANGKIYTGKNPRDGQTEELIISEDLEYLNEIPDVFDIPQTLVPSLTPYDAIRQRQNIKSPMSELIEPKYSEPVISYPSFKRYFLRRTNNVIFTEVSQIDFNAIKIKDPKYNFGIYTPFELIWTTSGANIAETNQKMTFLTEKRFKVYGLSKYITNYTEFST
tara:strand:- start:727 stop:1317 length:591 start_codon:yes stop_codon:yes gene_type:complete